MFDFGKIKFIQEHDDQRIEHEIRGDASLDEVVDAFESFLKGAGYHLKDGQHIGYEYDGDFDYKDPTKNQWYDRMDVAGSSSTVDTVVHSKYYWDTERNK